MLRPLILSSLFLGFDPLGAQPQAMISEATQQEVMDLITLSNEKRDEVLSDPEFQAFVADQKAKAMAQIESDLPPEAKVSRELYVFVSFSMGEKGLKAALEDAKRYGAQVVLKGFKDGSAKKTIAALTAMTEKTKYGLIIDPELFETFQVKMVPTIILSNRSRDMEDGNSTPLHDRISGNVTLKYALEQFASSGDLKAVASALLKKGGLK